MHLPLVRTKVKGDLIGSLSSEVVRDTAISFSLGEVEVDGERKGCVHCQGAVGMVQ